MSHGSIIALELAGAVLILAGFTLGQLRLLDQHSLVYLVLNLVGSFVLAVIAWVDPAAHTLKRMCSTSPSWTT